MGRLKKAALAVGLAAGLAAGVYFSPDAASKGLIKWQQFRMENSPKISSEADLEYYVSSEARRISPRHDKLIIPVLLENTNMARSYRVQENIYMLEVGGTGSNTYVVDHEIYHILAGDCDRSPYKVYFVEKMRYMFMEELKVTLYQETGKKF